ncbi:MAG TPA: excalibur domain-containing protein [Conexibacter sp.]|nr:excalibur domain-containing protein [Conexibacter sp.]
MRTLPLSCLLVVALLAAIATASTALAAAPAGHHTASIAKKRHCDRNYSGRCLRPNVSDYDCAGGSGNGPYYVRGPFRVVGSDHYGLDSDHDGTACES